jgi:hypothetical protein
MPDRLSQWVRVRKTDPDLAVHGPDIEWFRRCAYCGRKPGDDVLVPLVVTGVALVASAVAFWFAPLLGALMMIGAVMGLVGLMFSVGFERIGHWLSTFR